MSEQTLRIKRLEASQLSLWRFLTNDDVQSVPVGKLPCGRAISRIKELERIVEKLKQGPDENEARIHQVGDYQTGLHCGVEDRDLQGDAYDAADYGFTEGVGAVLEWVNGIIATRSAAEAAKEAT